MQAPHSSAALRSILALLAAFAACLPGWAETRSSGMEDTAPLQPVRVQLKWAHQFQFAGYYAAIDQGYYRDAGLAVTLVEYAPSIVPIDQLLGGRVDFTIGDAGALIYRSAGVPLVALAAIFQHSPSILISLESSGIRELQDLENRRAMLGGGYMNAELMAMLQQAGIGDNIQVIPSETSIDALINGKTDAYNGYVTNEPYLLAREDIPFISFQPRDYGVDFYGDILITTEATIARDPAMVDSFREATLKGWTYAVAHPETVVDLILAQYNNQDKTRDHLLFEARQAIELILPDVVPIGYMNEERWQRIESLFGEQGLLDGPVDMQQFLYQPDKTTDLLAAVSRYKVPIIAGVILLAGILMLYHILSLRTQIRARTRELEAAKRHAETEARTDALTGLPNRRHFLEELTRDMAQADRQSIPLSIVSVDIDYFKHINDRYGHAAGDEALRRVGSVLKTYIRTGDIAARIGGEEFALACLNTGNREARKLAERLSRDMDRTIINYQGESFQLTVSVGLAILAPGDHLDHLLRKADIALYRAKQNGRNRICEWCEGDAGLTTN